LPNFYDNFQENKIVNDEILKELLSKVHTFSKTLKSKFKLSNTPRSDDNFKSRIISPIAVPTLFFESFVEKIPKGILCIEKSEFFGISIQVSILLFYKF